MIREHEGEAAVDKENEMVIKPVPVFSTHLPPTAIPLLGDLPVADFN